MGGRSARALALESRLANANRFFREGPQRWSLGFSRPSLVNTPRFFRNGIISLLGPPAGAWAAGGRRALALESRLANAARFFRNGPQRWGPGFSRPPLINTPRFFRKAERKNNFDKL